MAGHGHTRIRRTVRSLRRMIACQWSARRIQRYLDADPWAPLAPGEVARLEAHLRTCRRCTEIAEKNRVLGVALSWCSGALPCDDAAVARLRRFARGLDDNASC
jgi:hypothetical protein